MVGARRRRLVLGGVRANLRDTACLGLVLRSSLRVVVQDHQLIAAKSELSIGLALVVGEFDLKHAGSQDLDCRANLSAE
jgi:hypothetical protein